MPLPPFRLYVVTDRSLCADRGLEAVLAMLAASLPPGTLGVELREKDLPARDLLAMARSVKAALAPFGVPLLVNDRLDVAVAAGADGVHLPASGLDPRAVRAAYDGLIGVSTHSARELAALDPAAVDLATFGPVFDTPSKRAFGPPLGLPALREAVAASRVPVFAIGGVSPATAGSLRGSGAYGVAVVSAVLGADDPAAAAAVISESVGSGG